MLSSWFERGLGQIVAPDDHHRDNDNEPRADGGVGGIWSLVAPDPNYYASQEQQQQQQQQQEKESTSDSSSSKNKLKKTGTTIPPPSSAFLSPPDGQRQQVLCTHCHRWTPVKTDREEEEEESPSPLPLLRTPTSSAATAAFTTPKYSTTSSTSTESQTQHQQQQQQVSSSSSFLMVVSPLQMRVLEASRGIAESMTSPEHVRDLRVKAFRQCAKDTVLTKKMLQRLRKELLRHPQLLKERSSHLGTLVPDGYTLLMAASHHNQAGAVRVLLDVAQEIHNNKEEDPSSSSAAAASVKKIPTALQLMQEVDHIGRTALHIAAENGAMDVLPVLLEYYEEDDNDNVPSNDNNNNNNTTTPKLRLPTPVDLLGHTPLGRAVVSRQSSAQQLLFSPKDVSVRGVPTPLAVRCEVSSQLSLLYGHSDMPGRRVVMEDALSLHSLLVREEEQQESEAEQALLLLGVCDGHGDHGRVSDFVANKMVECLPNDKTSTDMLLMNSYKNEEEYAQSLQQMFVSACLELDRRLQKAEIMGGSTAVWALVTERHIVTINVGDSRCILIQTDNSRSITTTTTTTTELEETMAGLTLKEEGESPPHEEAKQESSATSTSPPLSAAAKSKVSSVIPLSFDHKPDLEQEQARIEQAGMTVVKETFVGDDNVEHTIAKVQRSATDSMAVSRSFGDFEYKSHPERSAEEQAVVAVPDVRVHSRDPRRDGYLVLACDGVWDVMSNEQVADFVVTEVDRLLLQEEEEGRRDNTNQRARMDILPQVGDLLLQECLTRGSTDNMTVILVALDAEAERLGLPILEKRALVFQKVE